MTPSIAGRGGILLDTNVLIRILSTPETVDEGLMARVREAVPRVFVSVASLWEIAIKVSLGRLPQLPDKDELLDLIAATGFELIMITPDDAYSVRALPWHHRDPFDRILVGSAMQRNLTLATTDRTLARYDVPVVMAR